MGRTLSRLTLVAGALALLAVLGCSSAVPTDTPGVERLGERVLRYSGPEAEAVLGYRFAADSLGEEWMFLNLSVTGATGDSVEVWRNKIFLRTPFLLHFGGELPRVEIAYRIAGAEGAPVVAVLGGISAGRNVFKVRDGVPGWWDEIAGPGKALDTDRIRVLGIDFLGGSHRTPGPGHGEVFQSVRAHDQAACLVAVLDHLGIASLHGCIGASYGGMVTLVMGAKHTRRLRHGIVGSAAHRTHPMSTAWRSVQRNFVRYAIRHGEGEQGLALARALAMTTYRSVREFALTS